jgi:diacylglycerol kinase (ATP)
VPGKIARRLQQGNSNRDREEGTESLYFADMESEPAVEKLNCSLVYDHWNECLSNSQAQNGHDASAQSLVLTSVIVPDAWIVMSAFLTLLVLISTTRWVFRHTVKRTLDMVWFETLGQARHRRLILPPSAVRKPSLLEKKESLTTRTRALLTPKSKKGKENAYPCDPHGEEPIIDLGEIPVDFTPLLVFINRKSGGQKGAFLYRQLLRNLNPHQVFDLATQKPERILQIFSEVPNVKVLVCGGDGSINWILNTIEKLDLKTPIPVAVLPLGTGNDLARVLGWGPGFNRDDNIPETLVGVKDAHTVLLDRWEIEVKPDKTGATRRSHRSSSNMNKNKSIIFNNYFGIGVDATTALRFHKNRELNPEWYFSRIVNKLWYVMYGARELVDRSCAGLSTKVKLFCDGEEVEIPHHTEGIILLNINSFAGGVKMWSDKAGSQENLYSNFKRFHGRSSMHDGMLDVVAVNGSLHLGEMNMGLARPNQLCQGREITIESTSTIAMQVDGEPWTQKPCSITVTYKSHAHMLRKTADTNGEAALRMQELLTWASDRAILREPQYQALLREMSRRFM